MRVKVHGGTPLNAESSLCATCRHARVTIGRALDEELVLCSASQLQSTRITFKVMHCSAYEDARLPSYWDLMQQAWILQPGSRKRPPGFVRAADLRDEEYARYVADLRSRGHSER